MDMKRCSNLNLRHYYDASLYDRCPYCYPGTPERSQPKRVNIPEGVDGHSVFIDPETMKQNLLSVESAPKKEPESAIFSNTPEIQQPVVQEVPKPIHEPAVAPSDLSAVERHDSEPSSLMDEIAGKKSSVYIDTSLNNGQMNADDGKTRGFYADDGAEPVVGWLICVKGKYFGESFNLHAGQNTIGRSLRMSIALINEECVSRESHAKIIFDPKSETFIVVAGQSSGLTYLNGTLLAMPTNLKAYDKLEFGSNCMYIFMPLCGENFSWNSYVNQ